MTGNNMSRADFTVTKDLRVCYQTGPQVRNASNIREVQVGGGCRPKNCNLCSNE